MYCLDCKYSLQQLPENTCPECGRAFDPADSSTFAKSLKRRFLTLLPWEAIASIACSVIYFVSLFIDSQPSVIRHATPWYYNYDKYIAFIFIFGISIGLLLAVVRLKRGIAASLGLFSVLVMAWQIVRWVQGFLPYWF